MKAAIILIACLFAIAYAESTDEQWESFKTKFDKHYATPEEEAHRKELFVQNLLRLKERNELVAAGKLEGVLLEVQSYTDLTPDEAIALHPELKEKYAKFQAAQTAAAAST